MGSLLKQSSTAQPLMFLLISSTDHIAGLTGATPTVFLSKNGGSGASPSGAVTQVDSTNLPGWYKVAGNATDTNTLGPLKLHATATGADPCDESYEVVAFDPQVATNLGLSALPTAAPAAIGGLLTGPVTANTGLANITQINGSTAATVAGFSLDMSQALPGSPTASTVGEALKFADTRLDAAVTTRLAPTVAARTLAVSVAGQAGIDWANVGSPTTAVALTGTTISTGQTITSVSGAVGSVTGAVGSVTGNVGGNVVGSVGSVTGAVGSVTGNVGGNVVGTAGLTAAAVDLIWDEVQSGHTTAGTFGKYLDGQVSTGGGGTVNANVISVNGTPITMSTPATIADAVWDEVQSGHTTAGTFGKYVDSAISGVSTGGVSAAAIATAVWTDLLASSDFSTAASIGKLLKDDIDATISSRSTFAGGAVASVTGAVGSVTGNVGGNVTGTSGLSAAAVDLIWDEAQSGHTTAGTFGKFLDAQVSAAGSGGLTLASIADAVWDEVQSGHTTAGTFGKYVDAAISGVSTGGVSASTIADAVWDELLSGHVAAGSAGAGLATAASGATSGTVDANLVSVDGQPVDLASTWPVNVTQWSGQPVAGPDTAGYPVVTIKDGTGAGELAISGGVLDAVTLSGAVQLDLSQTGLAPRNLDDVADGSLTVGDCLVAALSGAVGAADVVDTTYQIKTPSTNTVIRSFTIDNPIAPSSRN